MSETADANEAREILNKFGTDEYPPVLDDTMQVAVRQLLKDGGMEVGFGILPLNSSGETPTNTMLSHDLGSKRMLDLHPKAIIGPYFLEGDYYAEGISIWIPKGA